MGEVVLRRALLRQGVLTREQLMALDQELARRLAARSAQHDAPVRPKRARRRQEGT